MNELIESIINKEYTKADEIIKEALATIAARKLNEAKKMIAAKKFSEQILVNNMGRVPTSVGTEPRSYYVQRKGLAEDEKEEAKKAALSIVSKRAETSDEKRKRFLAALEGPGSSSKQKPSMKVVKEQVPSPEDSAKVGRMAQQASDSEKIENIIKRDEDSRAVGELAKQKVEPKQPSDPAPMSKTNERPGIVGSGRTHGSHQHPKFRN